MSKSLRDKANHFAHHLKRENCLYEQSVKCKYTKEDIPNDIKGLIDLSVTYRYGNQRKMRAKMKSDERKARRSKEKVEFQQKLEKQ